MHKQIEDELVGNNDVVFMYLQTVFEGNWTNTFDNGIVDLDDFGVKGIYGFDPRDAAGGLPATMKMFQTQGTPYTIVLGKDGQSVLSDFTPFKASVRGAIDAALAVP